LSESRSSKTLVGNGLEMEYILLIGFPFVDFMNGQDNREITNDMSSTQTEKNRKCTM
jgi:hypothetical protein